MQRKCPVIAKLPMLLSLFALLFCGLASSQIQKLLSAPNWVGHSDEVAQVAAHLQKLIVPTQAPQNNAEIQIAQVFEQLKSLVSDNHFQDAQVQKMESLWTQKRDQTTEPEDRALLSKALDRQMGIFISHEQHLRELKSSLATFVKYVALHG